MGIRVFVVFCEFLSTPSARRATRGRVVLRLHSSISIHALREEGDSVSVGKADTTKAISIHALREEGDRGCPDGPADYFYFYPRPPRGGRRGFDGTCRQHQGISIHALREEGDRTVCGSELAF